MKLMLKIVSLSLLLTLVSVGVRAESQKTITYQGQREEVIDLDSILYGTKYRTEEVDSTCSRQIPYNENVCGYETRYRQECGQIPGRQVCRTVYDQQCRYETRYRQECSGGGRVCRTVPGDVVCQRMPNGENRCTKVPPREVCSGGQPVCRQVPYQERVCSSYPRQACDWEPSRTVCNSVPYQVYECRDVTRYRTETYACKKTIEIPYQAVLKTNKANVTVAFNDLARATNLAFVLNLSEKGDLTFTGKDPNASVAAFTKKLVTNNESGEVNTITAKYPVTLVDLSEVLKITRGGISNVSLHKDAIEFSVAGKFDPARSTLKLKIYKDTTGTKFDKTLTASDFTVTETNGVSTIAVNLAKLGAPKLGGVFTTKHNIDVELSFNYADFGDLIFPSAESFVLKAQTEAKVD